MTPACILICSPATCAGRATLDRAQLTCRVRARIDPRPAPAKGRSTPAGARRKNKYIVSAMVVIVLVIAIYWTQTKTQRHLEQRPDIANAAGKIEYQNESFNPRGVALPPNFHGADLLGIYAALKQRPALLKGEYETTESFNKRVEESAKQPVLGSLLVTSVYAFSNPVKRSQYDADRGVLDFQPLLGEMGMPLGSTERRQSAPVDYVALSIGAGLGMVFWGPTIYQTLLWEKKTSPATTYSASNAYGATMEVRKYSEEEFGVIWCATNDGSCPASISSRAFEVKMSADEAKAAKEGARFLVIGKLTDAISKWSYVIEFVHRSKPEMDKPLDVTTTARVLEFEASEIWVYDGPTGKVYLRVKLPKML